jgi:hypothetical protein
VVATHAACQRTRADREVSERAPPAWRAETERRQDSGAGAKDYGERDHGEAVTAGNPRRRAASREAVGGEEPGRSAVAQRRPAPEFTRRVLEAPIDLDNLKLLGHQKDVALAMISRQLQVDALTPAKQREQSEEQKRATADLEWRLSPGEPGRAPWPPV